MKNIDFLPDIYRHKQTLRHARLCWVGVGILFALAIAGAASGQWYFRSSLASQLQAVEPQYAIAVARQAEILKLENDNRNTEELAALYLYLRHPWPRTQLLAAVAGPLQPAIQLTELQLLEQADATPAARNEERDTNHATAEGEKGAKPTAKSVLARLRSEFDGRQTVLELSGEAASDKVVHDFVESLTRSPLFVSVSLKGLESGGEATKKEVSSFHIRAVVRPGYGQPGAPAPKAGTVEVAVADVKAGGAANSPGGSP